MAKTLKKTASGQGTIDFADIANYSTKLKVKHRVSEVRNGNAVTPVIKVEIDSRTTVDGNVCTANGCPPAFPAIVKVILSAPLGTDIGDLRKAADVVLGKLMEGGEVSPFLSDINEVVVA